MYTTSIYILTIAVGSILKIAVVRYWVLIVTSQNHLLSEADDYIRAVRILFGVILNRHTI